MSCCGQKRQAWLQNTLPRPDPTPPTPPELKNPVRLRHLANTSFVVTGIATGHVYLFSNRDTPLEVDERDVPALASTGNFALSTADDDALSARRMAAFSVAAG